ncbi:uncharacterized protein MONBRDRAFT_9500 [Monosiga brevicollis MX1]|uniref:Fatty acid desaturase domain-containing protein n=1 Tax=Monosiga brevicollis TaxID=81824 RepID=A9V3C6_MONBE|nr:uncharacterized protein MONBRDRAFT_9500 [Monosiga brevicollis MX1]EDQ88166.1 predicted protein [Monosiga brevicollis MX1]|eukprot:XP_001747242.1 hypothetical protein [Monosiga brevicollis MX1]
MVLTYQPNQVAKSWLAWQTDKPSAAHWHGIRRALLLRTHPEIKALLDYHQGGHAMHHLHAGTPYDNDATALFWAWEKVPVRWLDSTVGSVLWASAVALALPVIYFGSLLTWYCIHPALNQREVVYAAVDLAATAVAYRLAWQQAGSQALVYLVLSTAFSMGFLGHPLLAFWVTQHVCESPPSLDGDILCPGEHRALWRHVAQRALPIYQYTAQPSLSYYGSTMYNWLTVNELLHVEHHDFAQIPWTRLPWLARLAPQLYHGHDADGRPLTPCRCGGHEAAALSEELRSRTPEPNEGRQLAPAKSASACSCAEVRRFLLSTERAWQGWAALASPPQPADQREAEADTASNTGPYATQRERARCAPLSAAEQLAAVPPMTALYSLYGDIILPWLRARDMKFDFACRHTLETHVNSRQAIAFDIYTQLQRLPSGVARAAMEENAL